MQKLISANKYSLALEICAKFFASLDEQIIEPSNNLKKFYTAYFDLLLRGNNPIDRLKAQSVLGKAMKTFPNDESFYARKQSLELNSKIMHIINK